MSDSPDRHSRHRLFESIGHDGQTRLERARVAVVGCGALGSRSAELLARAGVGRDGGLLRIIDRDYVEESNLQRQALFDTEDAREAKPKATAARAHLLDIDPALVLEVFVRDLNPSNALRFLNDVDLIIDGTDNFQTRFLINDAAIHLQKPWIYAGVVAARGMVAFFELGNGPCLRCLIEMMPGLGKGETCDTAGIITPLPALAASMQVAAAMRWIVEGVGFRGVRAIDLWDDGPSVRSLFEDVAGFDDCVSCGTRELPALNDSSREIVTLCGRNSVQISGAARPDLDAAAARLKRVANEIHQHPESVTASFPEATLTVFDDGRVIVGGTTDPLEAQSLVSRFLGG